MFYNLFVDKKSLQNTFKQAYSSINQQTITIKSILLAFCADIERFFKSRLNLDIHKPLLTEAISSIHQYFPLLKNLTQDQLNRLLIVLVNVRNSNAHLHTNRNVYLDVDLRDYFFELAKPQFEVSIENKITIYGSFYILVFLSQKYQLWNICSLLFRSNLFIEVDKKTMGNLQISTQHYFQDFCGKGKPIYAAGASQYGKTQTQWLNEINKRYLTDLFFDLEMAMYPSTDANFEATNFATMSFSSPLFEKEPTLRAEISKIRNLWFHGAWLFDTIMVNDQPIQFDFPLIFGLLLKLKNFFIDKPGYETVIKDIHNYGAAIYDFFCLRLIEVSYKILDRRLLTLEKIDTRATDSMLAYQRLLSVNEQIFIDAGELINKKEIKWIIIPDKLSDRKVRTMGTDCLDVYHLHSVSGFDIGDFHTDAKDIALVKIRLQDEFVLKVNGKYLNEFPIQEERMIGTRIRIIQSISTQ